MQAQHYTLALGIAWIFTLAILPCLFASARQRAYDRGHADGLKQRDAMAWKRLVEQDRALEQRAIDREKEQRQFFQSKAALQGRIDELEERIQSYTGLAVTAADHQLMIHAAETLDLAKRTWEVMKGTARTWPERAATESLALKRLAELVHAEIRKQPLTTKAGSAA
ncbi:hypothetical protein [Pseudomonas japonica]|uniref:hypothetical protein n=1 Tax=Pseudomonas japonica TaxID=256466 RepID=UPI003A8B9453